MPRHSGRSARFPSRARIPRMRESPLKSGGVAFESARGEPESKPPFKSRQRGGRRRRKSPYRKPRHLDGPKTPMRRETNACFPKARSPNIPPRPVRENSPKPGFRLSARLRAKNGEPLKGCGRDRKSVPPITARAPAGMTVHLKIRGPGEPRKPKASTPERNKTLLKNYPPFRGFSSPQLQPTHSTLPNHAS